MINITPEFLFRLKKEIKNVMEMCTAKGHPGRKCFNKNHLLKHLENIQSNQQKKT